MDRRTCLAMLVASPLALTAAGRALASTASVGASGERLAIVGGTAITVTGATIGDSTILISAGRIERIGPSKTTPIDEGRRVIDARGKWITPGLIDSNAHMILTTIPEFFVKYEDRLDEVALHSAQIALKYGLTTIGDTWGPLEPLLRTRDRINRGEALGARLLVAGNIIGVGGPFTPYFMGGWDIRGTTLRYGGWVHPDIQARINAAWEAGMGPHLIALTPEEVGEAMQRYIARGVDFVKVGVSGHGIGEAEPLMFSMEALNAMRAAARQAGITFQTHTATIESLRTGVLLKPDLMQHPNVVGVQYAHASAAQRKSIDNAISQIKKDRIFAGLMMVPNKENLDILARWDPKDHPADTALNQIMAERKSSATPESYEAVASNVRPWLNAGIDFTLATDAGPEPRDLGPLVWGKLGRAHFERLEGLQALGATPMQLLRAATINGALAYRIANITGSLEQGKCADLLMLDANPLEDIANLRRIAMVMKEGAVVDRDALPATRVIDYDPSAPWPY